MVMVAADTDAETGGLLVLLLLLFPTVVVLACALGVVLVVLGVMDSAMFQCLISSTLSFGTGRLAEEEWLWDVCLFLSNALSILEDFLRDCCLEIGRFEGTNF